MATPTEMITSLDAALAARLAGGAVRSYTLPNGLTVNLDSLKEVQDLRGYLRELENEASGNTAFHLARLRPR